MSRLIIGAAVHTIGAYPSGWRMPDAHRDTRDDAAVLRRTARTAEAARLDYLFFGDRRPGAEPRDAHQVARVESLSAAGFLAALTERIGLVGSAAIEAEDPYALARRTASADLLSSGRAGIHLTTSPTAAPAVAVGEPDASGAARFERAVEFETVLRRLWDSFEDDAVIANAETGEFVDRAKVHPAGFRGTHLQVGPALDVTRPVQGHLPIFHSGSTSYDRLFAAQNADVAIIAARGVAQAAGLREELRSLAFVSGRDDRTLKVIAQVLPIVGESTPHAQRLADDLIRLVSVAEDWADGPPHGYPAARSIAALSRVVGTDLTGFAPDAPVDPRLAAQFTAAGQELVELVAERTGLRPGGDPPATLRHLAVTASSNLPIFVGSAAEIATRLATWADVGAADGFNVHAATHPTQFDRFARGVVPELQHLGVFPREYDGGTLRDHLGLGRPENTHVSPADPRFPPVYRERSVPGVRA
ncbi:NtaA/DmoA family FMN-dependent monooxygenase [Agromyces agglutinans]|nr:NtaA/DmoA family FMN-dependent monooxygenase [Agromyces agglutinans]